MSGSGGGDSADHVRLALRPGCAADSQPAARRRRSPVAGHPARLGPAI